ncbi:MAG: orotate phosphoribosyltransferase [Phycisphaerae bacterium]
MTRDELARRIRDRALLRGDFTLRSGRKSDTYIDKYLFETQPDILAALGRMLADFVTERTTRIAGAELGGVAPAAAVSLACGRPFVIVRNKKKDYGTARPIEGRLNPGDVVLLVEDVATTGGQILEAAAVLTEAGATIERIIAIVDRQEGARANIEAAGYPFEALFTLQEIKSP